MALIRLNNQSLTNITSAGLPSGSVLQVVGNTPFSTNVNTSNATTSAVDASGFTASITPISTSNKVLVIFTARVDNSNNTSVNNRGTIWLVRGSTQIASRFVGVYQGDGTPSNRNNYNAVSLTVLDTPATTSEVTYKIQTASAATANSITIYGDISDYEQASLVLMEIAG